jgi:oligopeptide/dipeptide ABC transporter ATP-binding protein
MTSRSYLSVDDLSVHFPIKKQGFASKKIYLKAVDKVSFEVSKGETLGLVGESGSGKTTTGRAILRLLDIASGKIIFDGLEVHNLSASKLVPTRRKMQIIFQDPHTSLNPRMSIQNILAEPIRYHGSVPKDEIDGRVDFLLNLVRLGEEYRHHYPHELSGGQRQRIGIARALALEPTFIVCDEPVSALDVSIQSQILNLLKEIQSELNLTYLFISHDLSVIRHISDRIAVLYMGNLLEVATNEALYQNPQHPYTQALLSAVPVSHPKEVRRRQLLRGEPPSPLNPPEGCIFHPRCPKKANHCTRVKPELKPMVKGHLTACHYPG